MMEQSENGIDQSRTTIIFSIAVAHFLLTVTVFYLVEAETMASFDAGEPPGISIALLNGMFRVLCLPLVTPFLVFKMAGTGLWGWLVFLANSALWGWAGWRLVRHVRAR